MEAIRNYLNTYTSQSTFLYSERISETLAVSHHWESESLRLDDQILRRLRRRDTPLTLIDPAHYSRVEGLEDFLATHIAHDEERHPWTYLSLIIERVYVHDLNTLTTRDPSPDELAEASWCSQTRDRLKRVTDLLVFEVVSRYSNARVRVSPPRLPDQPTIYLCNIFTLHELPERLDLKPGVSTIPHFRDLECLAAPCDPWGLNAQLDDVYLQTLEY